MDITAKKVGGLCPHISKSGGGGATAPLAPPFPTPLSFEYRTRENDYNFYGVC